ncbi:MAG TPA: DUF308 domain-containing protein [Streptosporangiaceae bacterium]|nr:DUF308 domain-containing protein [Streptosporangiaceae bacterium]
MSLNQDAVDQRVRGARAGLWRLAGPWWLMLVTGIAWLIISVMVLRFRLSSITTVGVLIGVIFLLAMFNEFLLASVRVVWRWAHVLLGVLFAVGAIWAFANPINAFWALASVLGLLLIFQGTLDIISSIAAREISGTWWLGLVAGILLILLGFWASQQMFPARAALLLLWVGFFALFRGISEIVIAFELRSRQHA